MISDKLISIIAAFDKYDNIAFTKFLESPYFNNSEHLIELYQLLRKKTTLNKEDVWALLFPKRTYNDAALRRLCSDLVKLAERFLAIRAFESDDVAPSITFLKVVNQRHLKKFYNSSMKNVRRIQKKQSLRDAHFYYDQYQIERYYNYLLEDSLNRSFENNIELQIQELDVFYISEKLKAYCEMLALRAVRQIEFQMPLMEAIIKYIAESDAINVPCIAIYYQIILTFNIKDDEDVKHYYKLKHLLSQYAHQFSSREARNMYSCAQNYCIRKINAGNSTYLKEIFDLYKDALEKRILLPKGMLSPWDFKNIVVVALRLGEYDWAEDFIYKYKDTLPITFRENAFTYNLAKMYFYRKDYDKVIALLQAVTYQDMFYNLDSRSMLLKTYYELDELEALYAFMDSFKIFLRRHRDISEHHRSNYMNLIRFVKRLSDIQYKDSKKLQILQAKMQQTKGIADINWLKQKIAEKL